MIKITIIATLYVLMVVILVMLLKTEMPVSAANRNLVIGRDKEIGLVTCVEQFDEWAEVEKLNPDKALTMF